MNLTRCSNGHFYDAGAYQHCPHCSPGAVSEGSDATRALPDYADATEALSSSSLQQAVQNAAANAPVASPPVQSGAAPSVADDSKTVGFFSKSIGLEPVVGWLVCVDGSCKGKDFRLKSGRNFIGRSTQMDVAVTGDNTVSRDRHAVVVYEPKNHMFLVQPGDSKELCYLNEEVVLTPQAIKINDVITVGSTKLMFFPCCSQAFNWNQPEEAAKS